MDYVVPFIEPLRHETFHFTRSWMQEQAARMSNFSSEESKMARRLNLPPSYLLIHRVTFGSIGVLCQLDATAPFREMVIRYLPGFRRRGLTRGSGSRRSQRAGHHHAWSSLDSMARRCCRAQLSQTQTGPRRGSVSSIQVSGGCGDGGPAHRAAHGDAVGDPVPPSSPTTPGPRTHCAA